MMFSFSLFSFMDHAPWRRLIWRCNDTPSLLEPCTGHMTMTQVDTLTVQRIPTCRARAYEHTVPMGTLRHARTVDSYLAEARIIFQPRAHPTRLVKVDVCGRQLPRSDLRIEAGAVVPTWGWIQPREVQARAAKDTVFPIPAQRKCVQQTK